MFFTENLPQSNLINPSKPLPCQWYIGLPLLSSNHLNFASNSLGFQPVNQTIRYFSNTRYLFSTPIYSRVYFTHELHAQLFSIGLRKERNSFIFSINEKNNSHSFFPRKMIPYFTQGNSRFAGENLNFSKLSLSFHHYREFAFTIAHNYQDNDFWGIRAKLLFGKLNVSTRVDDIQVLTDESTFDLYLQGNGRINTSLPVTIEDTSDIVNTLNIDRSLSPYKLLLNRKNPGFAVDFGITHELYNSVSFSASIIDLGIIRWNSNNTIFEGSGAFTYTGPLGDTIDSEDYVGDLLNSFVDSMNVAVTNAPYYSFLSPRITAGLLKKISPKTSFGIQSSFLIHKSNILPSLTAVGQFTPLRKVKANLSYSVQHNNALNFGMGLIIGKSPVQAYMFTDNILGFVPGIYSNNINIRFGLNLNLGCKQITEFQKHRTMLPGKCNWIDKRPKKINLSRKRIFR